MIGSSFVKLILIVLVIGITGPLRAHSPSEIGYVVDVSEKTLTIHATQKGLIDLLIHIRPELANSEQLQLYDHLDEYTEYFNSTVTLCIDDREIKLQLDDASLNGHDSTLNFWFAGSTGSPELISLKITSFTEIYRRTKNIVRISKGSSVEMFYLNRDEQYCEYKLPPYLP